MPERKIKRRERKIVKGRGIEREREKEREEERERERERGREKESESEKIELAKVVDPKLLHKSMTQEHGIQELLPSISLHKSE